MSVARHRLALHRKPGAPGKTFVEALPGFPGVARDVAGGLAVGAGPRPHLRAVHREDPDSVRVTRMEHEWEADVADFLRHVAADPNPLAFRPLHAVNAAMILLVEPVGHERMEQDAIGIVAVFGIGRRQKIRRAAFA